MYFWSYIDKKTFISILREHLAFEIKTEGIVTNIIQVGATVLINIVIIVFLTVNCTFFGAFKILDASSSCTSNHYKRANFKSLQKSKCHMCGGHSDTKK
jgi:hypothetical protein